MAKRVQERKHPTSRSERTTMKDLKKTLRTAAYCIPAMLISATITFAQDGGWPAADQQQDQSAPAYSGPEQSSDQNQPPSLDQNQNQPQYSNQAPAPQYNGPQYNGDPQFGQRTPYGQNPNPYAQQAPPPPIPAQLTINPGTYVTVRINQRLSSDHSRQGDAFTATLVEPVVVNGVVIAEPGETVGGVVANVEKGSTSKLLVQLTDLTLVDGQRLPLQTQLVARRGPGFTGNDAGTIVGTTAVGAAIGAVMTELTRAYSLTIPAILLAIGLRLCRSKLAPLQQRSYGRADLI